MVRNPSLAIPLIVAAILTASHAGPVAAQPPADDSPGETRVPALTISVGYGTHFPFGYSQLQVPGPLSTPRYAFHLTLPTLEGSVRVPVGTSLLVEGEVSRTTDQSEIVIRSSPSALIRESRDAINVGVNVLLPLDVFRGVRIVLGGGTGVQRTVGQLDASPVCGPGTNFGCAIPPTVDIHERDTTIRPVVQAIYGVDVNIAPRVDAYFALKWRTLGKVGYDSNDLSGVGLTGGVRAVLRTRAKPSAASSGVGKEVRVTRNSRPRVSGELVSLTDSEVVIRRSGRIESIPLSEVSRVETVAHHDRLGALIGSAYAGLMWITVASTRDTCADCEDGPLAAAMMTPVAIGAGAGIGALVNIATRNRHVVYVARGSSRTVRVVPIISPDRAGVAATVRW